ncbi:MAG: V-type ATP synthase subunit D [Clostridia bacterium]|nr:V-type ATP synthase subunit D [Clostridia bacterium]
MARLNVNPTRMELKKLKARLATAVRGHKLLKDKSDEMIRRFSLLIRENKRLRDELEKELADCLKEFSLAAGLMPPDVMEKAFSMPTQSVEAEYGIQNVMSVEVPHIEVKEQTNSGAYPYSFADVTSEADYSVKRIAELVRRLLLLAEVEKTTAMLAIEIERNKRRVNALEYVMIPQIEETIHYIKGKLDENERAAITRLMKVKSMISDRND